MKSFKTSLANGLRIATVPMKDHPTATVLVLVRAGSEYETKETNGLFHFLEHMCFKGTQKRPVSRMITTELDAMGAQYNAFTGNEFTGYFVKSRPSDFGKALDIVSDIYLHSKLPPEEFEKERGVIKEEISMYNDLPQRKVHDVFAEMMYGDQPAGRSIAGTKENIDKMKVADLSAQKEKFYVSGNTLVVASGGIDRQRAEESVKKAFSSIVSGPRGEKPAVQEGQSAPNIKIENKDTDQVHFVLGFRTFDVMDKRNPVLKNLLGVLDGGMSARLFHRMREELGICYYVRADSESFADHGFFTISAGVNAGRLTEAVGAVRDELNRIKKEIVPAEELRKAKNHLGGGVFLGLENSDAMAEFFGFQEIMKEEAKTPEEIVSEIDKVPAEEIHRLSGEIFVPTKANLAIIGKVKDSDKKVLRDMLLSLD